MFSPSGWLTGVARVRLTEARMDMVVYVVVLDVYPNILGGFHCKNCFVL